MKILIAGIILMICSIKAECQVANVHDATGSPIRVSKYDKVEGTPYIDDGKWNSGVVVTQTDQYLSDLKIRYNAFEDELQYLNNGNPFYYNNQDIKSFEFSVVDNLGNEERFFFKNGYEYADKVTKKNFVRVLFEGKNITVFDQIEVLKQKVIPASYGESEYDKFIQVSNTYLLKNGSVSELKLRKGPIVKAFPKLKNQLSSYMKENVIDYNSSRDVANLFQFIDKNM